MGNRNKKRRFKLRYIVFLFILFYIGTTFINQQITIKKLEKEKAEKQEEIKKLEAEINETKEIIDNIGNLDYIEKIARDELKMVKDGEIIFIDSTKKKDTFNIEEKPTN